MTGTFREPAFFHSLPLVEQFKNAPEQTEAGDTEKSLKRYTGIDAVRQTTDSFGLIARRLVWRNQFKVHIINLKYKSIL